MIPSDAFVLPSLPTSTLRTVPAFSGRKSALAPTIPGLYSDFRKRIKTSSRSTTSPFHMCICINCKYVTDCAAYHFVEERHSQPHMTHDPNFTPRDGSPTIHVNIRSQYDSERSENEIKKMWREYKQEEQAALTNLSSNEGNEDDSPAIGPTTYNLSNIGEVSYEYDVVKCEDFMQEIDCWVKNMPQEIREANPQFVPS